jgi:hypothetical protein
MTQAKQEYAGRIVYRWYVWTADRPEHRKVTWAQTREEAYAKRPQTIRVEPAPHPLDA